MNASLRRTNTHWLFDYQREWLRWDLMAGLITAAVVIPKAMAYATIAGLPVQVGLYTVLIPMTIYAIVGTSRPLSVSILLLLGLRDFLPRAPAPLIVVDIVILGARATRKKIRFISSWR